MTTSESAPPDSLPPASTAPQTPAHAAGPRILVVGSSNTDLVVRGPRIPAPGETVLGGEFYQAAGGKGANQAVAAARLGLGSVTFLAAFGDDALGRQAVESLQRERLDLQFIKVVPHCASGVALILVDAQGRNCISVASGANALLEPHDVDQIPAAVWQASSVLLVCLESPLATVWHALRRARTLGVPTILNPAPADATIARREWLELVDVLTPNETEATALSGILVRDEESAVAAARRLQEFGCGTVIVTRGEQGSVVVPAPSTRAAHDARVVAHAALDEHTSPWLEPACQVTARDTTAAGDCFSGALAVAIAERRPLREAVAWASRAAAISVTRAGAQPSLPTRAELDPPV